MSVVSRTAAERAINVQNIVKAAIALLCALSISLMAGCAPKPVEEADSTDMAVQESEFQGGIHNPIDWNEWINRNSNVYAWLTIDGTNVDLPILQHPVEDNFYLHMNIDGKADMAGALYTQGKFNTKELTQDPVTVVYGHTFEDNDSMFGTLHNFEDPTFFEEHPQFYVYTPTQRLTYEVVSAFEHNNKHLLAMNDMQNIDERTAFFNMVQNPDAMVKQVRTVEPPLNPETDKLLVLSTCTRPANDNARYLVVAVLRAVEDTEVKEVVLEGPEVLEEKTITREDVEQE